MKLLLIVDDYLPRSTKVAAKMMHELAVEFVNIGHEVTVLTPLPDLKKKLEIREIDRIKVLYFRAGKIKNTYRLKRAINESLLSFRAWKITKKYFGYNKHDAIIYYSPTIFWGKIVGELKKLWGVKSYLILRDIFPQWAVDSNIIRSNSLVYKYFKYFELLNYNNADVIGLMLPSNLKFFNLTYPNITKTEVLFNWAKITNIKNPSGYYRKKLKLEGKVVLFYGGNIGHAQHMINLIRLAKRFSKNFNVHFLFVGNGDEVELVKKEKKRHKLDNLTYLPAVDQDTYFEMLNDFDIGLFSLHPDHKTHNFPGKLLGYMAYSKPVLGIVNKGNDLKEIINNAAAGFIFENGDYERLYEAAVSLIESTQLRKNTGLNAKSLLLSKFLVQKACSQIIKSLTVEN